MKKALFFLMALAVFASALGLQVQDAKAEGTITFEEAAYVYGKGFVFIFAAEGYRNRDLREASIYIGSDFYDLFCWVAEDGEHIICNAQSMLLPFSHQIGVIYLAGYIFYVELPGAGGEQEEVTCSEDEVLGADVTFLTNVPSFVTLFIEGSSIGEVTSNATSILGGFFVSIDSVGELRCEPISEEEILD
jgi:hypothetical protein